LNGWVIKNHFSFEVLPPVLFFGITVYIRKKQLENRDRKRIRNEERGRKMVQE
jgi:hypothetical protein